MGRDVHMQSPDGPRLEIQDRTSSTVAYGSLEQQRRNAISVRSVEKYAIRSPSGDPVGSMSGVPLWVRRVGMPPVAGIV